MKDLDELLSILPYKVFRLGDSGGCLEASSGTPLDQLLPQDKSLFETTFQRAVSSLEPQSMKYNVLSKDGTPMFFEAHFTSCSDSTVLVAIKDITLEVEREQDIEIHQRVLQESNNSLEQFVYVASHDLREPLTGMAGFAALLKRKYAPSLDEQGLHFLEEIIRAAKRMEGKIEDLLTLSRVSRGNISGRFQLEEALGEAKKSLYTRIQTSRAMVVVPRPLPTVKGNKSLVAQVFQNLISNSIKYKSKLDPWITIEVKDLDDTCLIEVKDNGIGFEQHYAEGIFNIFQRLHTEDQYPGTGIGLAIVKKVIDRHGGRVWATSELNKGSSFFFTLPK